MDYMEKERDHFSQFVTEEFSSYIARKREDKCFGNNIEMQAISEVYCRPVEVYHGRGLGMQIDSFFDWEGIHVDLLI